ncbi:MAG TPA: lipopolysaccharide biosynthesis protein [Gemmatimonadaceae bacterium]
MSTPLARQAGTAVAWKAVQVFGSKAISLARYLVLARLLAPADFGLFAIALVPLDVLLSATDFGMVPALVQRGESDDRVHDAAWTVGLLRAAAVTACVLAAAPLLAQLFAEPRATPVLRVLALRPLIGALASIKVAALERRLEFRRLALLEMPAAFMGAVTSVVLAPTLAVWALVAGALIGTATRVVGSYLVAPHRPRLLFDAAPARSLFRFGRWVMLTSVVAVAGDAVLRAVISRRLGANELGLYFLAANLAALPNDVVSDLVVAVAFPVHARIRTDLRRAAEMFRASAIAMAAVLGPVYVLLIALAPSLVEHLLGPRWAGTESVLRLLSLAGILGISYDATAPMLEGRGEPHKVTALHAIISVTVVLLAWPLAGVYGLSGAALAWVLAQGIMLVACVVFARRALSVRTLGLSRPLVAIAAAAAAGGAIALALDQVFPGLAGFAVTVVAAGCAAAAALWLLDSRLDLGLGRDAARAFPRIAAWRRSAPRPG